MGQIVGGAAKPKRCNLNQLSQLRTPAAGEYILVSSDNSMNAAGQGNFDCYIEGNGTTAATALELKNIMPLGVFDLSAYTGSTYIDLAAALNAMNALPTAFKKGGMSVKFVQSSDNKYVQYRLISKEWSINVIDWQSFALFDELFYGRDNIPSDTAIINSICNKRIRINLIANSYWSNRGVIASGGGWVRSNLCVIRNSTFEASNLTEGYSLYAVEVFGQGGMSNYLGELIISNNKISASDIKNRFPAAVFAGFDFYKSPLPQTITEQEIEQWKFNLDTSLGKDEVKTDNLQDFSVIFSKLDPRAVSQIQDNTVNNLQYNTVNIISGIGTENPYIPFRNWQAGGTVVTQVLDQISPFKDIVPNHYITLFENNSDTIENSFSYNTDLTSIFPKRIYFSFWLRDSDWDEIDSSFYFQIGIMKRSPAPFAQTLFGFFPKAVLSGEVKSGSIGGLFSQVPYSISKVESLDGWSRILIQVLEDLEWNQDIDSFGAGIVLNQQQQKWTNKSFYICNPQLTGELPLSGVSQIEDLARITQRVGNFGQLSELSRQISLLDETVSDLEQDIGSSASQKPLNWLIGQGTISPGTPFNTSTWVGGTTLSQLPDPSSPFKDIIQDHYVSKLENTSEVSGTSYNYTGQSLHGTPEQLFFSFWVRNSDFDEIEAGFDFVICLVANTSPVQQIYFHIPVKEVLAGETGAYTSINDLITSCDYFVKKVNEIDGWSKIYGTISNIVWGEREAYNYALALVLNYQQPKWAYKSFLICEPQFTTISLSEGIERIQDVEGSISVIYPETLNDRVDANKNDILDLDNRVTALETGNSNSGVVLTYDASSKLIKIKSKLSRNYYIENSGGWGVDDSFAGNPCFNFKGTKIENILTGQTTLVNGEGDNISATAVQFGWIGSNHGLSAFQKVTINNHGKSYGNIGSSWFKGDTRFILVQIIDQNTLGFIPMYTLDEGIDYYSGHIAANDTLTYNGSNYSVASVQSGQWYPSEKIVSRKLYLDGVEIAESGTYKGSVVDAIEVYDVYSPKSYLDKLISLEGTLTANPLPKNYQNELSCILRYSNDFRFTAGGLNVLMVDWIILNKIHFDEFFPIDVKTMAEGSLGGSTLQYYLPKGLPITTSNRTYDFRVPVPYIIEDSINWTPQYWENPLLPPDRAIEFVCDSNNKRIIGLHHGYVFDQGVACGENRKDYLNDAWWIYTSRASYNGALDGSKVGSTKDKGDHYGLVCFRKYEDYTDNPNGLISLSQFEVNGRYYIYADFEAVGEYELEIPAKWNGKELIILEKSNNVQLISSIAVSPMLAIVSSANPMYGYLVIEIKPFE